MSDIAKATDLVVSYHTLRGALRALDASVQAQVLNLIRDLQGAHGSAALFISHDMAATRYVCDRIAVILKGEIVGTGRRARFLRSALAPLQPR